MHSKFTDIDHCRFVKLKAKCDDKLDLTKSVDMASLLPCRDCLYQHIRRVNYQVAIWKISHIPMPVTPSPTDGHGWTLVGDHLEPLWTSDIIPPQLVRFLQQALDTNDSSDDELEIDSTEQYMVDADSSEDEN